jgi:IS30 family transposase
MVRPGSPSFAEHQRRDVVRLRAEGWTVARIAARFAVSPRTIYRLLRGNYRCVHCGEAFVYRRDLWDHARVDL